MLHCETGCEGGVFHVQFFRNLTRNGVALQDEKERASRNSVLSHRSKN